MKLFFAFLLLIPFFSSAQDNYQQSSRKTPVTDADMKGTKRLFGRDFDAGYQTSIHGWIVKVGDTLQMGRGTLPDKSFAFAYHNPSSMSAVYRAGQLVKNYLPSQYTGNRLVIKELNMVGFKRTGFSMAAIVGAGTLIRYQVEIENAIEAGEILPPPALRKSSSLTTVASVADELLKLKSLLDAGALTREEYDAQKKKLLNP
ncbi:SHOCT domain-containing protein [Spirosoma pulveris]